MIFWNIIIAIAAFALQMVLAPKPQNAKPASLDDFKAPTAEEGREIPVAFGTVDFADPNVTWYGDLMRKAIKGARLYGLFGPRQILGYKYYLGMQMGLCHGVADLIHSIRVGDKEAWKGPLAGNSRFEIHAGQLFGGEESEGGIRGFVDICMGAPDQLQNDYLVSVLGENQPAYRGVVTAVLNQVYVGTSAYIKPWAFRLQRINLRSDGSEQWYPAKAPIPAEHTTTSAAFYFAIDTSSSIVGARMVLLKAALHDAIDFLRDHTDTSVSPKIQYDIHMVSFGDTVKSSIEFRNVQPHGFEALDDFVDALTSSGTTNFNVGLSQAATFLDGSGSKTRCIIIVSDNADQGPSDPISGVVEAQATLDAIGAPVFCFRMFGAGPTTLTGRTLEGFDNTPDDNLPITGDVPMFSSGIEALWSALTPSPEVLYYDMNPAHIIRECLTDATWGMGYNDGDIDDTSFMAAADTLYDEGFGLSMKWYREEEIQEFVKVVQSHIDAYLYLSRTTGKFVLKLIRNDYDINTIDVVDEDDVIEWTEVLHRKPSEAVSSVVVKFYNREKRKDGSHTVTNIAQAMQSGKVISTPREYPGINLRPLAVRVATRDVISLGSGMASGRLKVKRTLEHLNPGDPFRLVSDRHDIDGQVMRVAELGFGDGRNNQITLKFVQDVFNLGIEVLVDTTDSDWENPSNSPEPVLPRLVWEMPFRELRQMIGDADLLTMLTVDADAGMLQISGTAPTPDAGNADIEVDAGSGYEFVDTLDFSPGAFLDGALAIDATSMTVVDDTDLEDVVVGSLATIGGVEVIRVDAIGGTTLAISRGFLDTVPVAHSDGASVSFFDDFSLSDFEIRTAGDSIAVKLLTNTGLGQLDISAAPVDTVLFNSRAIRPLRPAGVTVEGEGYGPVDATGLTDISVEWLERNRLTETTPLAWTDATVAAEDGQTTVIEILDPVGTTILTTHDSLTGTSYSVPVASFLGNVSGFVRVGSERDGYREWQAHQIEVVVDAAGDSLVLGGETLYLGDEPLWP